MEFWAILFTIQIIVKFIGAIPKLALQEDTRYPIVHTNVGSIRGLRAQEGDYFMFLGIPFAQVNPENPFGTAKLHPNFEKTFDAFDDSIRCPQQEEYNYTIVGSLDCLNINVYVPYSASSDNRLPVLVWIFGGGFEFGFADRYLYDPKFLVRHDIIFVSFNYRVGPYGFMCLDIPEVPGNQGLKDQVLALRWIKNNIGAFGGDTSKITIAGNSAGATSVDFHLYYNPDENLYQRIISQSGTVLLGVIVADSDPTTPFKLAEILNYTPSNTKDALAFLASVDPHQVIAATLESGISFLPCIEKQFDGVERFVTDYAVNMETPRVKDIDVLIGIADDESYMLYAKNKSFYSNKPREYFVEYWLNMYFNFENEEHFGDMAEIVTHFYFGDEDRLGHMKRQILDIWSDFLMNYQVLRSVQKYLDNGVQTLYLYLFSYSGGRNYAAHKFNLTTGRATHADEIGYQFDIAFMKESLNPADMFIMDRMTEMWTNFIKYGNPTPEPTELVPVTWPPVTQDKWYYLDIDTELTVATRPMHMRMAFLELLYKMNKKYQKGYKEKI